MTFKPIPAGMDDTVEAFVDDCLARAAKYDHAELWDADDVYRLHDLVATVYARGFNDGARAQMQRESYRRQRQRDAERARQIAKDTQAMTAPEATE